MAIIQFNRAIQLIAEIMIVLGVIATAVAPIVLAIEVGEWLLSREWPGWSVEDGLGLFGIERGEVSETPAQRLIDVFLAIPLTVALFMIGINLFLGGLKLGDWGLDRARHATANGNGSASIGVNQSRRMRSPAATSEMALPVLRPLIAACAIYLARRAEARADYRRAIELIGASAKYRPLPAVERVHVALLMLHAGRVREAETTFLDLGDLFRESDRPNVRYLSCYCDAMVGMINGDTGKAIHAASEAEAIACSGWLRRQFPLPDTQG